MPNTREKNILLAILNRVKTQPTGLPVLYGNVVAPAPGAALPDQYISFSHSPNRPLRTGIDSDSHQHRGVFSLSIHTALNEGAEVAAELSGRVAAHFPPDFRLVSEGVVLRITQDAHVSGGYRDGDRWRTPVVVDYETITV